MDLFYLRTVCVLKCYISPNHKSSLLCLFSQWAWQIKCLFVRLALIFILRQKGGLVFVQILTLLFRYDTVVLCQLCFSVVFLLTSQLGLWLSLTCKQGKQGLQTTAALDHIHCVELIHHIVQKHSYIHSITFSMILLSRIWICVTFLWRRLGQIFQNPHMCFEVELCLSFKL